MNNEEQPEKEKQQEEQRRKERLEMARQAARMAKQRALKAPKQAVKKAAGKVAKQAAKAAARAAMQAAVWTISTIVGFLGWWGVIALLVIIILLLIPGPLRWMIEKGTSFYKTAVTEPLYKVDTYTHQQAQTILEQNGIKIESTGSCYDINNKNCTSLEGMPKKVIDKLIIVKNECGCRVTVTGGTEIGHEEHGSGRYAVDLKYRPDIPAEKENSEKLNNYLKANQTNLGIKKIIDSPHGTGPHIHLNFYPSA